MKKKYRVLLAAALATVLFLSACAPAAGSLPTLSEIENAVSGLADELSVDLYFENGVIYTADAADTVVEALAVADGKILFAGSAGEGAIYKAVAEHVVDLDGKMLMPGLIDNHIHSVAPDFFDFSLVGILSAEETLGAIQEYVQANPDKETYFGFGYMASLFEGGEQTIGPKKERLDEICPDKPMVIFSFDGHAAWLNSQALAFCNITKDTQSTPGGHIVTDENGELWGILQDTAMSFTADFPLDQQRLPTALKNYVAKLNAMGYTSIFSPPGNGFFPVPFEAYQNMADSGELNIRVRGAGLVTSWQTEKDLAALDVLKAKYNSDMVKVIGAKIFVDGVADNESAFLLEAYSDRPDYYGVSGWEQDALNQAVAAVNAKDLFAHFHSMGDAATRMSLDAVAYSQTQNGNSGYRNALTHLQLVAPEDLPRFNQLGVVAVANPYWHYKAPEYWEMKEYVALGERAKTEYPMKSFLDNQVHLAFASDYPVTTDPRPFVAIEIGVTRNLASGAEYGLPDITDMDDPAYLLWPEQRLTVTQMLRGFTIGGAYAMFAEQETGSLEPGKAADMIIIDQNLLTANPLSISDTQVLSTYLQGRLVYGA